MRSVAARHLPPLVAAIGFSLFQKIRFENDLIFFYGHQPIMDHFFIKIRKHELEQFERSLSSAALDRRGIDVAQDQVELVLPGKSDCSEIFHSFRENVRKW